MSMKKQGKSKSGEYAPVGKQSRNLQASHKITDSGITQPHNAKKEGLGPNTDR